MNSRISDQIFYTLWSTANKARQQYEHNINFACMIMHAYSYRVSENTHFRVDLVTRKETIGKTENALVARHIEAVLDDMERDHAESSLIGQTENA